MYNIHFVYRANALMRIVCPLFSLRKNVVYNTLHMASVI